MNNTGTLTVTTPTDREIVLRRVFDAPRRMVFDAFTKPELLKRWFGARGWNLVVCEVDLRVGGSWRFVSRGPDGTDLGHGGVYRVIQPPARLVYTELFDDQSYPGESLITHVLVEHNGMRRGRAATSCSATPWSAASPRATTGWTSCSPRCSSRAESERSERRVELAA